MGKVRDCDCDCFCSCCCCWFWKGVWDSKKELAALNFFNLHHFLDTFAPRYPFTLPTYLPCFCFGLGLVWFAAAWSTSVLYFYVRTYVFYAVLSSVVYLFICLPACLPACLPCSGQIPSRSRSRSRSLCISLSLSV
jgi:hypothetical protein